MLEAVCAPDMVGGIRSERCERVLAFDAPLVEEVRAVRPEGDRSVGL